MEGTKDIRNGTKGINTVRKLPFHPPAAPAAILVPLYQRLKCRAVAPAKKPHSGRMPFNSQMGKYPIPLHPNTSCRSRGRDCTAVCRIQPVRRDILYHGSPPYRCRRFSRYLRSSFSSTAPMTSSSHFTIRPLSFGRCPSTLMQFDAPMVAK
jgi:hypothetical protein